ncbi:MAG: Na+/H+ antiporter NhaC family protein [Brevinema sp.]
MRFLIILATFVPALSWGQSSPQMLAEQLGIWTLIPPILAITLAFLTRQVIVSLFVGLWAGALIISFADGFVPMDLISSFTTVPKTIVSSLNSGFSAGIIMQVITIGGLIALIGRNGGAKAVAEKIASKARSAVSAQLLTWVLGIFIFFDDYANALITGSVMRPVTDKLKVSREKLAFIVDATAAPIASIALISTWIGFELSTMNAAYEIIGQSDANIYSIFMQTIPYRFYNILMIVFVVMLAISKKDFGPMLKAEQDAQKGIINHTETAMEQNSLNPKDGIKLNPWNALVPLMVLIVVAVLGFYVEGSKGLYAKNPDIFNQLKGYDLMIEILGASSASFVIFQAALIATIVAFFMTVATKTLSFQETLDTWTTGAKSLFGTAGLTLILSWAISSIIKALGTNYFLVSLLDGVLMPELLPMIIFIFGMIISFATGTSYGTMGILMPLAIPLAFSLSGNDPIIMIATSSAVLAGAVFGDHCSPISDSTILSSVGSGCSMISHVETQMPYALLVGGLAILSLLLVSVFKMPLILVYGLMFGAMFATIHFVGKKATAE